MIMSETRAQIKKRLNDVFIRVFDDDKIRIFDQMTAADLEEWDSLMHVMLVLGVEKEFGLSLNAKEVGALNNVGEMITILEARATK